MVLLERRKYLPALPGFRAGLCALGFLTVLLALLRYPQQVRQSVAASISQCLTVLTPSLFPFMVLSSFAVISPAAAALGGPLGGLTRKLFRLPGHCAAPVLMSFLGGYPAGARGISLLLEQGRITQEQAGRMLLFCVNPGVAFVITFLGWGMLGSGRLGLLLFVSVTLTGILLGVLAAWKAPRPEEEILREEAPGGGALIRSVNEGARSVLLMCACVVLFSGFTALLHGSGVYGFLVRQLSRMGGLSPFQWGAVLSFGLEVTGGVGDALQAGAGPAVYAFGLGFGGLCVHMQVFAFFPQLPVKRWKYFLFRLMHGLLSAGCCLLLQTFLPHGALAAWAPAGTQGVRAFSGTAAGGASVLLMCGAFLLMLGQKETQNK